MHLISTHLLQSDSKRQAWYRVELFQLQEGWVVIKRSGATGSKGVSESWWRETEILARAKYDKILQSKTGSRVGRKYRLAQQISQVSPVQGSFSW